MSDSKMPQLSPRELLELEELCDAFERDLATKRQPGHLIEWLEKASPGIRQVLRREIENILREFKVSASADWHRDLEHTTQPSDLETQHDGMPMIIEPRRLAYENELATDGELEPAEFPSKFGRLVLQSIVGRGGSGVVWRAFDESLNRLVALKIAHPDSVADSKRFVREAQAVARLKHPNIVPAFEAGEINGRCYIVSEFCDGQPLSKVIQGNLLETYRAVEIVRGITSAIAHSHSMGTIHRDLKPQNVMIARDGTPMVTDFGLAKSLTHDQTLTLEGELIGTPAYMAPEQAGGGISKCDERTDVYSIGVVLYQLLSGKVPFTGSFERVVFQVINSPAPWLPSVNPNVPQELAAICAKCLEKSPERRFQSAEELNRELQRFLDGQPVATRKVSLAGRYVRWLQREPAIAWATTTCATLLLFVAIGSSLAASAMLTAWQKEKSLAAKTQRSLAEAVNAREQEAVAQQRAKTAERRTSESAALANRLARANRREANFLTSVFAPLDLIGINQMVHDDKGVQPMSISTIEYADRKAAELPADAPIVKARIKGILGNAWRSRGRFDKAESFLQEAHELLTHHCDPDAPLFASDFAMNHLYWAYLWHHREDFAKAESSYRKSINLHRLWVKNNSGDEDCILHLAQAEFGLGALFMRQKRNDLARPFIESSLNYRREHLAQNDALLMATELSLYQCDPNHGQKTLIEILQASDASYAREAIGLYWKLTVARRTKDYDSAIDHYRRLIDLISTRLGEDNPVYMQAIGDFAGLLRFAGKYDEAFLHASQAIEKSREYAPWHPQRLSAMMLLAYELRLAGRYSEALDILGEVAQSKSHEWSDSDRLHLEAAWCCYHLSEFDQAVEHSRIPLRSIGHNTAAETAWISFTHARMLEALGDATKAREYDREAVTTAKKMFANSNLPEQSTWLSRIGIVLTHHGLHREAAIAFQRAIDVGEKRYFPEHPRVAGLKVRLARSLLERESFQQAEKLLLVALAVQRKGLPADDQRIASTKALLHRIALEEVPNEN